MSSALVMRRLTRRMTGASDARSFNCCTSASNVEFVDARLDVADHLALRRLAGAVEALERGFEFGRDRDHRPHRRARSPSGTRRSCSRRSGRPSRARPRCRPRAAAARASRAGSAATPAPRGSETRDSSPTSTSGSASCAASASATSRCATTPSVTSSAPSFSPDSCCRRSARSSVAASSLPRSIRISPMRLQPGVSTRGRF